MKKIIKYILVALTLGVVAGLSFGWFVLYKGRQFDDLNTLKNYHPKQFTRVYDRNGKLIDIISAEKRILLEYRDIPKNFVYALVATEDKSFFKHFGVSPMGILSAIKDRLLKSQMRGASTLTQQLVKNITKDKRASFYRKFKEQLLAVQVEIMFTKEEIFAMYANEIALGNNQFGIESAARYYFGKPVGALNLEECATLAGIPQAPTNYNPYRFRERCRERRVHVLNRMLDQEYITREERDTAAAAVLTLVDHHSRQETGGGWFVDKIRAYLFDKYGEERVRTSRWDVYTTLDLNWQKVAEEAMIKGLKKVDKKQGYRPQDTPSIFKGTVSEDENLLETYFDPTWRRDIAPGVYLRGLITDVQKELIMVRIRDRVFSVGRDQMKWVQKDEFNTLFKVGDVPLFQVAEDEKPAGKSTPKDDKKRSSLKLLLDQEPLVEGGLYAIDNKTGAIRAMVGGYSYKKTKFNMAEQAKRQVGSAFKPILYGAAFESGYTLSDLIFDEPTVFVDPVFFESDEVNGYRRKKRNTKIERAMRLGLMSVPRVYEPHNYHHSYSGFVTLRLALAQSKNIVAVKLLNLVGYDHVLEYVYRMGLGNDQLKPFPSMALGAFEMTLSEMTHAYATFAMNGIRFDPLFVTLISDRKGRILEKNIEKGEQVISPGNAYLVTSAMRSVIEDPTGTGRRARSLGLTLAGKTGTTDDYSDAWFMGFNPDVTVGVWVGHHTKKTIGRQATGASTALPIWIDFFKGIKPELTTRKFTRPSNIVSLPVDRTTGKRITADCDCDPSRQITEDYIKGMETIEICDRQEQSRLELPWFLQKSNYKYDNDSMSVKPAVIWIDHDSQVRGLDVLKEKRTGF
jgi:penicillin-binding protein 1A